jgi:DNA-binding transcriptional MocR family regulator
VIRLDTFSKLLGPGLRLGWLTAAPAFAARVGLAISASTLGPASLSHVYMARLLADWGDSGLETFVSALQRKYARQAALAHAAAERHLSGLATWRRPDGGMFMWLKLTAIPDSMELLEAGPAAKVAVVPGTFFWVAGAMAAAEAAAARGEGGAAAGKGGGGAGGGVSLVANGSSKGASNGAAPVGVEEPVCPYFRVSFVSVAAEDLEEGFRRLGVAIRSLQAQHAAAAAAAATATATATVGVGATAGKANGAAKPQAVVVDACH